MKYRYPAPFDAPSPDIEIKDIPFYPIYCGPPLPVSIPVVGTRSPRMSLYKDLFGSDLSVLSEVLDSPWVTEDQYLLASQLLDGRKGIEDLDKTETDLLDDVAARFNAQEGIPKKVTVSVQHEKLRVSDEDDSELYSQRENPTSSYLSPSVSITKAYD